MEQMNVAFLGLGKMGSAMVERILLAGYSVTVFNRTAAKAEPLVQLGAKSAASLAQAVERADVVLSCLLNDEAVLTTTQEMVKHMKPQAVHACISTVLPQTAMLLNDLHKAHNSCFVSAVVLGIPRVVHEGLATTYCAGEEAHCELIMPLLRSFATQVIPLGGNIKAANTMKICLNYSLATTIELISELYVFAEKSGLDTKWVQQGLHQIYAHPAFKLYVDKIHERTFDDINFTMAGGNKDIKVFQDAFAQAGVVPELGNVLRGRFISALSQGMEDKDWSGIYDVVRNQAGLNDNE